MIRHALSYPLSVLVGAGLMWTLIPFAPQRFGPWTIVDGAGRRLQFVNVYSCHSSWPSFTDLGVYDARAAN